MFRPLCTRLVANSCLRSVKFDLNIRQLRLRLASVSGELVQVRTKYVTSGVQGRRSCKTASKKNDENDENGEENLLNDDIAPEDTVSLKDRYGIWYSIWKSVIVNIF